ncbi:ornithine cyclodeaminase family protein [Cytobacillus oceanisediminis]|uniref:ornithine cyclodeaminase family protein n=1 Tax=Cytobacillus TaxID=2675230 RepID=UPI00203BE95E|nr:ornithine cyclodeaminase family protein [Cytobacillus oceanisediminis]MBY0156445.1 ornithine cyclodeaminase family protein [Cytobacillus firmus]MCM3392305.1 ornithine cyclodeaminase family protein [Cytobacillus oceanisediminis]MCM3530689.1 ornithine cyclodeaminase family protein [Cytobacillus oceanisediminis]
MLVISKETIKELYSMEECIQDVEKAFSYGQRNKTLTPVRMSIPHSKYEAETLYMPSYIEPENYTAVKVVSIFPRNSGGDKPVLQGVILLTDTRTGEHVALMDASYLTVLRTGASSGVATKYLARKNSKVCSVLGCGAQAAGQIQAVMSVMELEHIILYNRTIERAEVFKNEIHSLYPDWRGTITIQAVADEAAAQSDIVICSTKSSTPIFNGSVLREGTHINAIGSYQAHMQEVDSLTLIRSNKVVVDTLEGAMHEAGDFLVPHNKGEWNTHLIYGEIGEIVCGEKAGREKSSEITFYKSVGVGFLDTMAASKIYRKALSEEKGYSFSL